MFPFGVCPGGSEVKASACNAGDLGLIPGSRRSPGEGNGNQVQYSCLENPMDGGAWWATVYGVTKSWTWLSDFIFFLSFHFKVKEFTSEWLILRYRQDKGSTRHLHKIDLKGRRNLSLWLQNFIINMKKFQSIKLKK